MRVIYFNNKKMTICSIFNRAVTTNIKDKFMINQNDLDIVPTMTAKPKFQNTIKLNPYDRLYDQLSLIDECFELYINKLKSKDAIITYEDPGNSEFNEQRYNAEIQQLEDKRRLLAQQILASTNLQVALKLRAEYDSIVAPSRDDSRFYNLTFNEVQVNVKDAYKRLLSLKDKWDTVIRAKEKEIKAQKRQSYKIYNYNLLKDNECFEAIVAIIKHPCVVRESERINNKFDSDIISTLKYVRAVNVTAFDTCKTITDYHKLVDDGVFDTDVILSVSDKERLAATFVQHDNNLLDGHCIECITAFKKRFDDAKQLESLKVGL